MSEAGITGIFTLLGTGLGGLISIIMIRVSSRFEYRKTLLKTKTDLYARVIESTQRLVSQICAYDKGLETEPAFAREYTEFLDMLGSYQSRSILFMPREVVDSQMRIATMADNRLNGRKDPKQWKDAHGEFDMLVDLIKKDLKL